MKNQPLVAIIIPSYKGEDTIYEVVRSALNQDYNNIEVIVVDDNGEGTLDQIETRKKLLPFFEDSRFKYIVHDVNKNGSAARNTGLRNTCAKYISFLDDDDYFFENKVSCCVNALEKLDEDFGMAYTAYILSNPDGKESIINPNYSGDILNDFVLGKIRLCSSSVVLRREAVISINGFDESFKRHQDWEFFVRILSKYKAYYVDEICMKKVLLKRNSPPSAEIYEKYRIHFLNKMSCIFDSLEKKNKKEII